MSYDLDEPDEWKTLREVDTMGIAQLYSGIFGTMMGFFGLFYVAFGVLAGVMQMTNDVGSGLLLMVMSVVGYAVVVLLYTLFAFIIGLIVGVVLNFVLGKTGGLRFRVS
jgi:uncharacterized membrane protein